MADKKRGKKDKKGIIDSRLARGISKLVRAKETRVVIQGGGRIITARATLADCHIQINFYTRQPHHVPCNDRHLDAPAARKIMHTPSQTRCSSKRETSCNRRSLERNFRTACQIVLHTQEKRAKGSQIFSVLPLTIQARLLVMQ